MLPRLLHLHPATCRRLTRLSKEAERDGAYRVAKRLQAVVLNAEGRTSGELAAVLQAPRSKISEWLAQYQAHGIEGLLEGYRSGRPPELAQSSANNWETFSIVGRWLMDWTMECGPLL
jgi:transposase